MKGSFEYASPWRHASPLDTWTRCLNPSSVFSRGKWKTRQNTNKESRENSEKASYYSQEKETIFYLRPPEAYALHIVQVGHKTSCVAKQSLLNSVIDPSCSSGWNHEDFFAKGKLRNFHGHYQKVEMKSPNLHPLVLLLQNLRCRTSHTLEIQKHHV